MHFFSRLTVTLAAFACLSLSSGAHAATTSDASQYVQSLGDQALASITDKGASKDQKQAKLEKIFTDNVDFPWVGRFVMGRFWREASDTQKTAYVKAYQRFLILHYTSRFTDYTSGTFKVLNSKDDGDGEFTVSMQMQSGDKQSEPVLVDYRVRAQAPAGFKIFDVIVEGVSMITTQRSEFNSVLTANGIDYLINQLSEMSKTGNVDAALAPPK
jgi:phospholipid transport system substrate-binding protein